MGPMTIFAQRHAFAVAVTLLAAGAVGTAASAEQAGHGAQEPVHIEKQEWTFGGLTGHFDKAQLRRGYMVYKNVCAACHGLRLLSYRNLGEPGGPEFNEANVTQFA